MPRPLHWGEGLGQDPSWSGSKPRRCCRSSRARGAAWGRWAVGQFEAVGQLGCSWHTASRSSTMLQGGPQKEILPHGPPPEEPSLCLNISLKKMPEFGNKCSEIKQYRYTGVLFALQTQQWELPNCTPSSWLPTRMKQILHFCFLWSHT